MYVCMYVCMYAYVCMGVDVCVQGCVSLVYSSAFLKARENIKLTLSTLTIHTQGCTQLFYMKNSNICLATAVIAGHA